MDIWKQLEIQGFSRAGKLYKMLVIGKFLPPDKFFVPFTAFAPIRIIVRVDLIIVHPSKNLYNWMDKK
jgi:hypothetical protein